MFRWEDIVRRPADDDPRFELKPEWVPILQTHAHQREMAFLCTPFAPWAVPVLEPYVDGWKIGSFEALYTELVFALPADKKPLLLSLGMSWDRNIARLMGFIRSAGVILVHCVSKYPTPIEDAGLIRLKQYRNRGFRCGYSSHTAGWIDVVVASTYGISVVEKHFALDDQPISPDAGPWSLRPAEFTRMVKDTSDAIDARLSRFQRADCPPRRRIFGI
jgi:sialic acid synthase SpsE